MLTLMTNRRKAQGTVHLYSSQGIRTTLVCCTGGEVGDILNPAMDSEIRTIYGISASWQSLILLRPLLVMTKLSFGYRDSGMPDSEPNSHPDAFANADLDVYQKIGRSYSSCEAPSNDDLSRGSKSVPAPRPSAGDCYKYSGI